MKLLSKIGLLLSLVALPLFAGPLPFTQNQFPVFYLTSGPVSTTSSGETNLFQSAIPNNVLLGNGVLRVTMSYNKAQLTNSEILKTYIGGTGNPPTGGTCISTNTLVASAHGLVSFYLVVTNAATSVTNTFVGTTTTNTFNVAEFVNNPVFSTATNALNFTVTGTGDGSNSIGADFILGEFIGLP